MHKVWYFPSLDHSIGKIDKYESNWISGSVVGGSSCSKIVLVDVFHPDIPNNAVRTYAVMEEQSHNLMHKL